MTARRRSDAPMFALLRANMRAAEIRAEQGGSTEPVVQPIMRGAPTHSCAHLLQALDEDGWELRRKRKPLTEEDWNAS